MKEYRFEINGTEYNVCINNIEENIADVTVNGMPYTVGIKKTEDIKVKDNTPDISLMSTTIQSPSSSSSIIKSPLPGVITFIKVKVGESVSAGQTVALLEAMKMENSIESEVSGIVTCVHVEKGDSLLEGDAIITIG